MEVADDQRSLTVVDGMRQFNFDACLSPDTTQPEVMIKCGVPRLLDSALHGYAATIFAYGQTGSGKTFSMSGREELIERQDWAGGGGRRRHHDAVARAHLRRREPRWGRG